MHAHRQRRAVQEIAIGPNPADAANLALAQANGEIGEIRIARRGRGGGRATEPSLAARILAARGDDLFQPRRPDHLPRQSRTAVEARDRRAFGRCHDIEIGEPRPGHAARGRAEQSPVDDVASKCAGDAPGDGTSGAEHRTGRAARDGKNQRVIGLAVVLAADVGQRETKIDEAVVLQRQRCIVERLQQRAGDHVRLTMPTLPRPGMQCELMLLRLTAVTGRIHQPRLTERHIRKHGTARRLVIDAIVAKHGGEPAVTTQGGVNGGPERHVGWGHDEGLTKCAVVHRSR